MKTASSLLFILSFCCMSYVVNAQNTQLQKCENKINLLIAQRDSLQALYFAVLTRLDSLTGDYLHIKKEVNKTNEELTQLNREVIGALKSKSDADAKLATAKKLIADQNDLIQKLEAEVKRLSQKTKTE